MDSWLTIASDETYLYSFTWSHQGYQILVTDDVSVWSSRRSVAEVQDQAMDELGLDLSQFQEFHSFCEKVNLRLSSDLEVRFEQNNKALVVPLFGSEYTLELDIVTDTEEVLRIRKCMLNGMLSMIGLLTMQKKWAIELLEQKDYHISTMVGKIQEFGLSNGESSYYPLRHKASLNKFCDQELNKTVSVDTTESLRQVKDLWSYIAPSQELVKQEEIVDGLDEKQKHELDSTPPQPTVLKNIKSPRGKRRKF